MMGRFLAPDERFNAEFVLQVIERYAAWETGDGYWLRQARFEARKLLLRLESLKADARLGMAGENPGHLGASIRK